MSQVVMINGQHVPPHEASVSVFDRGFLYGDSVFETLRTYDRRPFKLDLHLERLSWSARRVLIELPVALSTLAREVAESVVASKDGESSIRIMITRGTADTLGLDRALSTGATRVILVGPLHTPSADAYHAGVSVMSYRTERVSDNTEAAGAKVGNYLVAVLAMHAAKQQGALEALIVDGKGRVLEGATSNVFAVIDGVLVTPPLALGILPGITRRVVLELAPGLGLATEERELQLEDLSAAEEVFISSSIREILPVVRVDQAVIGGGTPGPVTQKLLAAFRDFALQED